MRFLLPISLQGMYKKFEYCRKDMDIKFHLKVFCLFDQHKLQPVTPVKEKIAVKLKKVINSSVKQKKT